MIESDTYADWENRAKKELGERGIDTLSWSGSTGLNFKAYFPITAETKKYPVLYGREEKEWDVFESISVVNPEFANTQALAALNSGASGLIFIWDNPDRQSIKILLKDIALPYIQIGFETDSMNWQALAGYIRDYAISQEFELNDCNGFFQTNFTQYADGKALANAFNQLPIAIAACQEILPVFRFSHINTAFLSNAGLPSDWELAVSLAIQAYLLETLQNNLSLGTFQISLGVGSEYFSELVKFRIALHLSQQVAHKFNASGKPYLMAHAGTVYMSHVDRYTNILRLGTAAMSSVLGGCQGLILDSFSKDAQEAPDFVNRITRNIHLVLMNESGISSVQDPAAGSPFLEEYSFGLAEQAWSLFVRIQNTGGIIPFFDSGELEKLLKSFQHKILEDVNSGKRFFLGVNRFAQEDSSATQLTSEPGLFMPIRPSISYEMATKISTSNG